MMKKEIQIGVKQIGMFLQMILGLLTSLILEY